MDWRSERWREVSDKLAKNYVNSRFKGPSVWWLFKSDAKNGCFRGGLSMSDLRLVIPRLPKFWLGDFWSLENSEALDWAFKRTDISIHNKNEVDLMPFFLSSILNHMNDLILFKNLYEEGKSTSIKEKRSHSCSFSRRLLAIKQYSHHQ